MSNADQCDGAVLLLRGVLYMLCEGVGSAKPHGTALPGLGGGTAGVEGALAAHYRTPMKAVEDTAGWAKGLNYQLTAQQLIEQN